MFINSRKCFEVHEGERRHEIPRNFIGEIPDWVAAHWLVKAAIKDGSIATPRGTDDKEMEKADQAAKRKTVGYHAAPDGAGGSKKADVAEMD